MFNELQKLTIQAIVNVFETGSPSGDYSRVTLLPGDPGHLTYGRSQTSLASGNLARLVRRYCAAAGSEQGEGLRAYLPRLEACDASLDSDSNLHSLLRAAGYDPAMRRAQDEFFDRAYWDPALRAARALGIETALGTAVVYDSFIHGAWARMRRATAALVGLPSVAPKGQRVASVAPTKQLVRSAVTAKEGLPVPPQGTAAGIGELAWIGRYIAVRREWLATHTNALLRRTVYRMDTFAALAAAGNWDLDLPLEAHGMKIDEAVVATADAAPTISGIT